MSKKKKKYKKKRPLPRSAFFKIPVNDQKKSNIKLYAAMIGIAVLLLAAVIIIIGITVLNSGNKTAEPADHSIRSKDSGEIVDTTDTTDKTDTIDTTDTAIPAWNEITIPEPEITEIPETTEKPTIPETTATVVEIEITEIEIITTTELPPVTTVPATTDAPLPPPVPPTTAAAPEPIPEPVVYDEIPQADFLQKMFENAFEIPGTLKIVEQPPNGRSIESQLKIVPLSLEIPEPFEYFKNIIFLGDSVTSGFDLFKSRIKYDGQNVLRDANVVASVNYGVFNSAKEVSDKSIHPLYEGKQMLPEDIIEKMDAKIVLICMGLNDVSGSIENYVAYYKYLVDRIKYKSPDKTVAVMSVTPTVEGVNPDINNIKIMQANEALIEYASENHLPFIDYGAALRDSSNSLYKSLASDGYCHLTIEGYDRLVAYILHHPVITE